MYITQEQLKGFDSYKYRCVDTSPLANYIMHPFWNQFVKLFPKWLAPNLMTFAGFLLLVAQFVLLAYYDPHYSARKIPPDIPMWVWVFSVFAQFFSHTLDGIDGKQARRTGTSSPLGEMFDHGLDSWSASFFIFNAYSVFGREFLSGAEMFAIFWATLIAFLLSHWEKYNTGVLFLPWAYDGSQVALAVVYAVTAIYGPTAWTKSIFGISSVDILRVLLWGGSLFLAVPTSFYNVYVARRDGTGKQRTLYEAALPLFSPLLCCAVYTVWTTFSPGNILDRNPRLVMFATSVILSNILCRLIVAQMSGTRCQVLNPFVTLSALCFIAVMISNNAKVEVSILWAVTIAITLAHIHYGIVVVNTLADHLGIKVFKIPKQSD